VFECVSVCTCLRMCVYQVQDYYITVSKVMELKSDPQCFSPFSQSVFFLSLSLSLSVSLSHTNHSVTHRHTQTHTRFLAHSLNLRRYRPFRACAKKEIMNCCAARETFINGVTFVLPRV